MCAYFDDRAVRVQSLFHGQIRSIGTFLGIALALFGFSDRFARFGPVMRLVAVAIMLLVVWFALTADRQFVKYASEFPPGETKDDMLTWRVVPLALSASVVVVAALTALREIA
eukprot:jgi/Tetstr1/447230/TSEL_034667.t1